jgi:putative ABC transport system permease protein
MSRIALHMLFGRPGRFAAMVFGMSFAVLLITQQISIFLGVLERSTGALQNIGGVDLWVAAKHTAYIDMVRFTSERQLPRLQSIAGVAWAKPFFSQRAIAEVPNKSFVAVDLVGIDRTTLIGQPPIMLEGSLADLRAADAVRVSAFSADPDLVGCHERDSAAAGSRRIASRGRATSGGIAGVGRTGRPAWRHAAGA